MGAKINMSCSELVCALRQVHFLLQDISFQANFSWHTDFYDLRLDARRTRTVVVQLSSTAASAMQVFGCEPYLYTGAGAGVLFHGGAVHRSLPWETHHVGWKPTVWKVALFLEV